MPSSDSGDDFVWIPADRPIAAVDGVVRAVLVDQGTEAGRAKFESHYDFTAPLLRLRLTLAPLFELVYVAVR